jgi:hypothetical protein
MSYHRLTRHALAAVAVAVLVALQFPIGGASADAPRDFPDAPATEGSIDAQVRSMATADFNHDGRQDIVANGGPDVRLMLGRGDIQFDAMQSLPRIAKDHTEVEAVAASDVNGDGNDDVVAAFQADGCASCVAVFLGQGNGNFNPPNIYDTTANGKPTSVTLGDLTGDWRPDLVVTSTAGVTVMINRGGTGVFDVQKTYPTASPNPVGAVVTDVNEDGRPDVLFIDQGNELDFGRIEVLPSAGAPTIPATLLTFRADGNVPSPTNPSVIRTGDFDGDGHMDFAIGFDSPGTDHGAIGIVHGTGVGSLVFVPGRDDRPSGRPPGSTADVGVRDLAVADVNNDGNLDVVATQGAGLDVWHGDGHGAVDGGTFYDMSTSGGSPWALAVADLDNNGSQDIVTADGLTGVVGVLRNQYVPPPPPPPPAGAAASPRDGNGSGAAKKLPAGADHNAGTGAAPDPATTATTAPPGYPVDGLTSGLSDDPTAPVKKFNFGGSGPLSVLTSPPSGSLALVGVVLAATAAIGLVGLTLHLRSRRTAAPAIAVRQSRRAVFTGTMALSEEPYSESSDPVAISRPPTIAALTAAQKHTVRPGHRDRPRRRDRREQRMRDRLKLRRK